MKCGLPMLGSNDVSGPAFLRTTLRAPQPQSDDGGIEGSIMCSEQSQLSVLKT